MTANEWSDQASTLVAQALTAAQGRDTAAILKLENSFLQLKRQQVPGVAGAVDTAFRNAMFALNDLRTLRSRMDLVSANCQTVAEWLRKHPKVYQVDYLGQPSYHLPGVAKKYMKLVDSDDGTGHEVNRYGHLMSFRVDGPPENARKVFDGFKMIYRATDLGRIKSVATIPAISTHQQQGEEARRMADVPPQLIRLCVGAEHPDDVIGDLEQALNSL